MESFMEGLVNSQMSEHNTEEIKNMDNTVAAVNKREILKEIFATLRAIDVSDHIEYKPVSNNSDKKLAYLNWAWAQELLMTHYPDAIVKRFNFDSEGKECQGCGVPYFVDGCGFVWVKTSVTIEGHCIEQILPVLDSGNNPQKTEGYTITMRKKDGGTWEKKIEPIDSMSVNTSLQRCFVKNLAMWGLGVSLYEGDCEDLPEQEYQAKHTQPAPQQAQATPETKSEPQSLDAKAVEQIKNYAGKHNMSEKDMCDALGSSGYAVLNTEHYGKFLELGKNGFFKKWDEEHKSA